VELTVHLYNEGLIDAESAMKVLSARISRRTPIGRLAVEKGLLTVKEVMSVLQSQADTEPALRFGEMAIVMRLLTNEELEFLLRTQRRAVPSEGELIQEFTEVSAEQIFEARKRAPKKAASAA